MSYAHDKKLLDAVSVAGCDAVEPYVGEPGAGFNAAVFVDTLADEGWKIVPVAEDALVERLRAAARRGEQIIPDDGIPPTGCAI